MPYPSPTPSEHGSAPYQTVNLQAVPPAQEMMPNHQQPSAPALATPQQTQTQSMRVQTSLFYDRMARSLNGPSAVQGIRIPGDGSPILRKPLRISMDRTRPTNRVPFIARGSWPDDPTATLFTPTLHAQYIDSLLRGYYILFARIDATSIPPNRHMSSQRICGDAYLLKLNEEKCQIEAVNELEKFNLAIYEDMPQELPDTPLMRDIMDPRKWKTLPPNNIVRLGLCDWQETVRKRSEEGQAILAQRNTQQLEQVTKECESRHQRKRERPRSETEEGDQELSPTTERTHEDKRPRHLPFTNRFRNIKKSMQNEEKQEKQRPGKEKWEMMVDGTASADERLRGSPYNLRPGRVTHPSINGSTGSPYNLRPRRVTHDPSINGSTRRVIVLPSIESSSTAQLGVSDLPQSSRDDFRLPELWTPPSFSLDSLPGTTWSKITPNENNAVPGASSGEQQWFGPTTGSAHDHAPGSSLDGQHRSWSSNDTASRPMLGSSIDGQHGFNPTKGTASYGSLIGEFQGQLGRTSMAGGTPYHTHPTSFQGQQGFVPNAGSISYGMPTASFREQQGCTPMTDTAPHFTPTSFEGQYGSMPMTGIAPPNLSGASFEQWHGQTPITGPAPPDLPGSPFETWCARQPNAGTAPRRNSGLPGFAEQSPYAYGIPSIDGLDTPGPSPSGEWSDLSGVYGAQNIEFGGLDFGEQGASAHGNPSLDGQEMLEPPLSGELDDLLGAIGADVFGPVEQGSGEQSAFAQTGPATAQGIPGYSSSGA